MNATAQPLSASSLLERAGAGAPAVEPMPVPDHRVLLPMRDGVSLDTQVWLPGGGGAVPAILIRTPYKESVLGYKRLGVLRYVEAGYAVVIQTVRGIGASTGAFSFNAPHEGPDGHDTVEWIATQPWCDGQVGMDGSSYAGMTQLRAAAEQPPHLRCIVPAVPSVDFFREVPYMGGCFARVHTINWAHLLQIDTLAEQRGGFLGLMPVLSQPDVLARMSSRPLSRAADGELQGDFLQHYQDVLAHPSFDAWWQARTLGPHDYARMGLPALVVAGNFDFCIGALALWRGLEQAQAEAPRQLLIGPWNHGQCYAGGGRTHGPYDFGDDSAFDLPGLRLAFFDLHLKGRGHGPDLQRRATVFITGANAWRGFDEFPPREVERVPLRLASGGHAQSARGDGRLQRAAPQGPQPCDRFVDDPAWPFVTALAAARGADFEYDMAERQRDHGTLVYDTGPLEAPLTLLGEPEAELTVAADVPDADVVLFLVEQRADGRAIRLSLGQLRLRYREGFDAERWLAPGEPVAVRVAMTYIGHQLPAGSRLQLMVSGSNFPLADPNPHVAGSLADATALRVAVQTVFHDAAHPSRLWLPVLPAVSTRT
jgi:putative CocE/NonD family hydrolase